MEILFFALILLGIPFVLPIVAWVSARRVRARIQALEQVVESQRLELTVLSERLSALGRKPAADSAEPAAAPKPARAARQEPAVAPIVPVTVSEPVKSTPRARRYLSSRYRSLPPRAFPRRVFPRR